MGCNLRALIHDPAVAGIYGCYIVNGGRGSHATSAASLSGCSGFCLILHHIKSIHE